MAEIEMRIKEMIIQRYGSMKKFCEKIDMPWTTLDSILKRGIANSNISNVLKITKELRVNTELLVAGIIKPTTGDDLLDYYYDKTSEIIELIENDGYTVLETNSPYDDTIIIKDTSGNLVRMISQGELLGKYEKISLSNPKNIVQDLLDSENSPHTIAAHHDGEEWTDEELDEIEEFKKFVLSKRK